MDIGGINIALRNLNVWRRMLFSLCSEKNMYYNKVQLTFNMGLNCMGPLIFGFFSTVNTTQLEIG